MDSPCGHRGEVIVLLGERWGDSQCYSLWIRGEIIGLLSQGEHWGDSQHYYNRVNKLQRLTVLFNLDKGSSSDHAVIIA